jgi:bifunctional non-homologous end joining protein LigD
VSSLAVSGDFSGSPRGNRGTLVSCPRSSLARFPWIAEAALKNRRSQFVIDGEAVILGLDGMSDFNALHSRKQNHEVQLCGFDVLAMDREDLRILPLSKRKTNLDRLLRGRSDSIFVNPFEQGAIGPALFRAACDIGLEGLVSKRGDRPYRGGRSKDWIKVKNRQHHAFERVRESSDPLVGAHRSGHGLGPERWERQAGGPARRVSECTPSQGAQIKPPAKCRKPLPRPCRLTMDCRRRPSRNAWNGCRSIDPKSHGTFFAVGVARMLMMWSLT